MGLGTTKDPTFDERGQRIPHGNKARREQVAVPRGAFVGDLTRGRTDIAYFAFRFLGIRLNPGQRRWLRLCTERAEDGYSPRYLTTACAAGNRAGKTLGMAILVAHQSFYKLGIKPPGSDAIDSLRWARAPFAWYHLGPQQEQAELVFNELVAIFEGRHRAQEGRGCPLFEAMNRAALYDKKYRGEYLWIRWHPVLGGAEIHFRTTQDKAKALLGKDMNGISFDEAAIEDYLDTIRHEVLHLRRLSTGGPLHYISTGTEGYNAFADVWEEGNPANPNRNPRTISVRLSTRENIGFGVTRENFDAMVDEMISTGAEYLIPQNIDGYFVESREAYFNAPSVEACFDASLDDDIAPVKNHRYVQGVDPASESDATWVATLDFTDKPITAVRARRRAGRQSTEAIINMVREGHLLYNQGAACTTIIDDTAMGGKLFRKELSIIRPLRAYDFAGTKAKKLRLLSDLKTALDKRQVVFPRQGAWLELRRQLLGYQLTDKKLDTDAVFAVALAVHHATRSPVNGAAAVDFDYFATD